MQPIVSGHRPGARSRARALPGIRGFGTAKGNYHASGEPPKYNETRVLAREPCGSRWFHMFVGGTVLCGIGRRIHPIGPLYRDCKLELQSRLEAPDARIGCAWIECYPKLAVKCGRIRLHGRGQEREFFEQRCAPSAAAELASARPLSACVAADRVRRETLLGVARARRP